MLRRDLGEAKRPRLLRVYLFLGEKRPRELRRYVRDLRGDLAKRPRVLWKGFIFYLGCTQKNLNAVRFGDIPEHICKMLLSIKNYVRGPYTLTDADGNQTIYHDPVPHKWLPGDTIDLETGKVLKSAAPKHPIVGIVDFVSRTGQGFSPRGVPLYMFYPLDESYPPMIVGSKQNPKVNCIATATLERWENKWPRAALQTILGPVGDRDVEARGLLLRASPIEKMPSELPEPPSADKEDVWDAVFHIDPPGCRDVDDVFLWRRCDDGSVEFGIGIADVASWVPAVSTVDDYARAAGQTLYVDGVPKLPMLPDALSCNAASLLPDGRVRPMIVLVHRLRDAQTVEREWRRCWTRVHAGYSYDSVLSNKVLCESLCAYLGAAVGRDVGDDPHRWVELAMIHYNQQAAYVLRNMARGYLRTHSGRSSDEWVALAEHTGCAELAHFGAAAGTYTPSVRGGGHAGLGLDCYAHASSPLRRYADLVNQRWLVAAVVDFVVPEVAAEDMLAAAHLNARAKAAKALDRDMWFLTNLDTHGITETRGFIVGYKEEKGWSVYVPAFGRTVKSRSVGSYSVGDAVGVRVFTNLKSTSWSGRIVCELVPLGL